jgi:hypothetical protein
MSTKSSPDAKPRTRPAKSKGGRSAVRSPAKTKATTAKAAKAKGDGPGKASRAGTSTSGGNAGATKRLRPGELDGLVLAHMGEHGDALPLGPGAIAKGIGRSSGAVGNCLERLAKSDGSPVRRVTDKPRAYDLEAGSEGATA